MCLWRIPLLDIHMFFQTLGTKIVTVTEPPVYGLVINSESTYLTTDTPTLTVTATEDGTVISTATITWESNNLDVATIDNTGAVTFLSDGEVTITAFWTEHSITATKNITISAPTAGYGNAFEYVYTDNGIIKSKVIANEDSYPLYDEQENYVSFVEYWQDIEFGHKNYIVYLPDTVSVYQDNLLVNEYANLTGLPIHYASLDKSEYNFFGDSALNDLIPIMNQIETLLSKLDDAINTLSMNPLGVSMGQRITDSIPKDICGATLNLEDGGDFKYVTAQMDYNNIKLLLDSLTQQLYAVANVPAAVIGQGNIANVSEISLKLLFSQTDNKAKQMIQVLKEGMYKRFEYIRKLLTLDKVNFTDDMFDGMDVTFTVNRPIDTNSLMNELKTQYDMGAISRQTIIDKSPYTVDTSLELQRIEGEVEKSPVKK